MSDTLSELEGCDLLARLFKARGYKLLRNQRFQEYGVEFHCDGWDPQARVGFEFLTSEDDDHDDLTLEEYQTLAAAQRRGELAIFVIDEVEPLSLAELAAEAHEFLDAVADAAHARVLADARRTKRRAQKKAGGKKPAVKKAAAKKPGRTPAAKTPVRKKAAAKKKPAAKRRVKR